MKKVVMLVFFIFSIFFLQAYENALEIRTDVKGVKVYIKLENKNEYEFYGTVERFFNSFYIFRIDDLQPGLYQVKCEYEEYDSDYRSVNIPSLGSETINVYFLEKTPDFKDISGEKKSELIKKTGNIIVRSKPVGAFIELNNSILKRKDTEDLIKTDGIVEKQSVGQKKITCFFDDYQKLTATFFIESDDSVLVMADFFDNEILVNINKARTISSDPEGDIYLDSNYIGYGPQTLRLFEGTYTLQIRKKGYNNLSKIINIDKRILYNDYKLEPNYAAVQINTDPEINAEVWIDENKVGNTPFYDPYFDAGKYELRLKKDRWETYTARINVIPEVDFSNTYKMEPIMGQLSVTAKDIYNNYQDISGVSIYTNGSNSGKVTPTDFDLQVGNYTFSSSHPDYIDQSKRMKLNKGDNNHLIFELESYDWYEQQMKKWRDRKNFGLFISAYFLCNAIYCNQYDYDNDRDVNLYLSLGSCVYPLYCFIQESNFNSQLKSKRK